MTRDARLRPAPAARASAARTPRRPGGPVQTPAELVATRPVGAYTHLTFYAPGVAPSFRPGQFVALTVGGPTSALLLRRAFSVHRATPIDVGGAGDDGAVPGTVEIVVGPHGPGTQWLVSRRPGEVVDLVGPLGRPFALPAEPAVCTLVGGGYGAAPLFPLATALRARGCRVDMVLGAASADRVFGALEAKRSASSLTVTTEDGSAGSTGRVTDVLEDLLLRTRSDVVYACGPMGMLAAVTDVAVGIGVPVQTAVEESMACGIGVCMTCVLPVIGADGVTRMVRSCVEGPIFAGDRVRWSDVGTVPADALGAPAGGGH